jgi:hypothetical protein
MYQELQINPKWEHRLLTSEDGGRGGLPAWTSGKRRARARLVSFAKYSCGEGRKINKYVLSN